MNSPQEFCWINEGQTSKWNKAERPEGGTWTGTVHRPHCSMLGARRVKLSADDVVARQLQTCRRCGGDGKALIDATSEPTLSGLTVARLRASGPSETASAIVAASPTQVEVSLPSGAPVDTVLQALANTDRLPLRDLLSLPVPKTAGIYALWHRDEFLYVGIAFRDPTETTNPNAVGVQGRLRTYLDAWLTTDFTLATTLRYVLPYFTAEQMAALGTGSMRMRDIRPMVKKWIAENIRFSCVSVAGSTARLAEATARRQGLPNLGPPSFNPAS